MKRRALLLASLFLAAGAALGAGPGDLPDGLRWGMPEGELAARFALRRPRGGETGDWVAEGLHVSGALFDARLFLRAGALARVVLVAPRGAASPEACAAVERDLRARLGEPAAARPAAGGLDEAWRGEAGRVDLLCSRVRDPQVAWEGLLVVLEPARDVSDTASSRP